jgi:DNA modification methylase
MAKRANAIPGKSRPPSRYKDGKAERRDLHMKHPPKKYARVSGQDLMRGEHVVGKSRQTASLKGGLTLGTTIHPYDGQEGGDASATGTSIFDPVLCELAYRWFCPPGGSILDPFAGGSVRGVVASKLERRYLGIELRREQIAANEAQAQRLTAPPRPEWICGDARDILPGLPRESFDLVFTCPPYGDLEVYSDDPRDLSAMSWADFQVAYYRIILEAAKRLKDDSFAIFVVGDLRDPDGFYRLLPTHTILAFQEAGLRLYNEAVLVTATGSLPIRVGKMFEASRKLGKTHQNVLVFAKGDPRKATSAIGLVESGLDAVIARKETPDEEESDGAETPEARA